MGATLTMKCPRCQHENRPSAKFCEECAAPLARDVRQLRQPSCPPTAKFCSECAHPPVAQRRLQRRASARLSPTRPSTSPRRSSPRRAALEGERKQVTVLFADLKGSMELLADRDPEEARKLLDPVLERMMEAVHRYEGTVNQVMGDGIMALFGAPLAHEDHAVRACYAALRMQEAVKRYAEELRRTAGRRRPDPGRAELRRGGRARRSAATCTWTTRRWARRPTWPRAWSSSPTPGTILLTPRHAAAGRGLRRRSSRSGPVPVKGLREPVEVYELIGAGAARSRLQAAAARGLTRFVGRDAELEQLRRALERAGGGHGQVVALVGEPGVGKSRLVWEFTHSHRTQGWLVLESGSVSYGKATALPAGHRPAQELLPDRGPRRCPRRSARR